jgi:DNA-binding PadR family transcriptional regulator
MSAKHALLGLLLDRSAYPYELADRLQHRLGPAWRVNSGQLYQLVKGLQRDGLIERVEDSPEHEDRHVFAITDAGVGEFERWFTQTADPVRLCRRPLLVKITFAGPQRLAQALAQVDAYELQCAQRLREISKLRETLPEDGPLVRADHLLLRLNLSADLLQLEGELRWARHAREMLSWLASRDAVWPSQAQPATGTQGPSGEGAGARRELFQRMAEDAPRRTRPGRPRKPGSAGNDGSAENA